MNRLRPNAPRIVGPSQAGEELQAATRSFLEGATPTPEGLALLVPKPEKPYPEELVGLGLPESEAKRYGLDTQMLTQLWNGNLTAERKLVLDLFPGLVGQTDVMSVVKAKSAGDMIQRYARTELSFLGLMAKKFRSFEVGRMKEFNSMVDTVKRCREEQKKAEDRAALAEKQAREARGETAAAVERNGIFATEEKRDLANAREQLKALKVENEGWLNQLQAEEGKTRELEIQVAQLKREVRDAEVHAKVALERLQDRYPEPTPFWGTVIDELKQALGLLPQ